LNLRPLDPQMHATCDLDCDLRRNQVSHGAAGAGLSSALSSLLSSTRSRVLGPTAVAVVLVAMPGWPWATSPRSGELIMRCWATGTIGLFIIVRYRSRPGVGLKRCARIGRSFRPVRHCRRTRPTLPEPTIARCSTTTIPHRRRGIRPARHNCRIRPPPG
jgi:hypothetical protein